MNDSPRPTGTRRLLRPDHGPWSVERDVDEEIRFHIEERIADLVGRGDTGRRSQHELVDDTKHDGVGRDADGERRHADRHERRPAEQGTR